MSITRFDPFLQLNRLQDRVNRIFEGSLDRSYADTDLYCGTWCPPVDISETENELVLRAELPGLTPKDVDVQIENNTLTLKGERRVEREEKKENYHRQERSYGTFVRSFTLPSNIQQDKVGAEFKNGLLEIRLPKKEESKPKQIQVKFH